MFKFALVLIATSLVIIFGWQLNKNFPGPVYIAEEKLIPDQPSIPSTDLNARPQIYGDWIWVSSIDSSGKSTFPKNPNSFVLTIEKGGKIRSTTDCNFVSGSFVESEGVIDIGKLDSTDMDCRGITMEGQYVSDLSRVSIYSVTPSTLTLKRLRSSNIMNFVRKQ